MSYKTKYLSVMLTGFIFSFSSILADNKPADFRKTNWGMNSKQVITSEGSKPARDTKQGSLNVLAYVDKIANLESVVTYILAFDQLVRAKYTITEEHTNKTDYIDDFDRLKEALLKKYGKPISDNTYWKNDLYKDDPSKWGLAISVGHLSKYVKWETSSTSIFLFLNGDKFEVNLGIEYESKELAPLEEKAHKEEDNSKL